MTKMTFAEQNFYTRQMVAPKLRAGDPLVDAADEILQALTQVKAQPRVKTSEEKLAEFSDTELIMEMLRRGYAVLKCPEPGQPPEALKDG
jgi:hypothetical protein